MLTRSEFIEQVVEKAKVLNPEAAESEEILETVAEEVTDRISLYLNLSSERTEHVFDDRIVGVAARIAGKVFAQTQNAIEGAGEDMAIASVSDNGQSVSYHNEAKNYLATVEDNALFSGFSELLKPYRRLNVVS